MTNFDSCKTIKIFLRKRKNKQIVFVFIIMFILFNAYVSKRTKNPRYGKVFYEFARKCSHDDKCHIDKQIQYYRKAVFYNPNLPNPLHQFGIFLETNGKEDKAFDLYKKACFADFQYTYAQIDLGRFYLRKGKIQLAKRHIAIGYKYRNAYNRVLANYYMARIDEEEKNYKRALGLYEAASSNRPEIGIFHFKVGLMSYLSDNKNDALMRDAIIRKTVYISDHKAYALKKIEVLKELKRDDLASDLRKFIDSDGKHEINIDDSEILNTFWNNPYAK